MLHDVWLARHGCPHRCCPAAAPRRRAMGGKRCSVARPLLRPPQDDGSCAAPPRCVRCAGSAAAPDGEGWLWQCRVAVVRGVAGSRQHGDRARRGGRRWRRPVRRHACAGDRSRNGACCCCCCCFPSITRYSLHCWSCSAGLGFQQAAWLPLEVRPVPPSSEPPAGPRSAVGLPGLLSAVTHNAAFLPRCVICVDLRPATSRPLLGRGKEKVVQVRGRQTAWSVRVRARVRC